MQGKLRIGTAAQTVQVALAHAFASPDVMRADTESESVHEETDVASIGGENTMPVDGSNGFLELLSKVTAREPPEARSLRTTKKMSREEKNDCAVAVIKRGDFHSFVRSFIHFL